MLCKKESIFSETAGEPVPEKMDSFFISMMPYGNETPKAVSNIQ